MPVHPKETEILGRPAHASLSAVPGGVDLAIIVAPPGEVPVDHGGLRRRPRAGRRRDQRRFRRDGRRQAWRSKSACCAKARAGGVRLIGPNCFGVISTSVGLNGSLGMGMPARGGIALFTQSGAYGMAAFSRSQEELIGFSRVVACGNKADLDETDLLRAFGDDPETRVIAMLLEFDRRRPPLLRSCARDRRRGSRSSC